MQIKKIMNTDFVGHHISAGGYIFTNTDGIDKVLLIKNKKDEWWIPKGHIEENESELEACLREIKEEVGIDSQNIDLVNFLEKYNFYFKDKNNKDNTKEINVYVFSAKYEIKINIKNAGDDIISAEWVEYEKAKTIILQFCLGQLTRAYQTYKSR